MNHLKIYKENLDRNGSMFSAIISCIFSIMGIVLAITEWKSGITAIIIMGILGISQRLLTDYFKSTIIIAAIIIIGFSYVFDFNFFVCFINCILFLFIYFFITILKTLKSKNEDLIFSIDKQKITCLSPEHSDYKGYALKPSSFYKTLEIKNVISISFNKQNLEIISENTILRARELTSDDIERIYFYIQTNLPHLLNKEKLTKKHKEENQMYIYKIIFALIIVLGVIAIYFFANNGKDIKMTFIILGVTLICIILFKNLINLFNKKQS